MSTITIDVPIEVEAPAVTASDLLRRAADILEEFHWLQGSTGDRKTGAMCAVGAIYEATSDFGGCWWNSDAQRSALLAFGNSRGEMQREADIIRLALWNDEPGRTKAEVVAKLRELAAM